MSQEEGKSTRQNIFRDKGYFKLNISEEKSTSAPQISKKEKVAPSAPENSSKIKEIFSSAGRQIIASVIILVVGFFLLNWSAYYQIVKNKFFPAQNQMEQLVDDNSQTQEKSAISLSDTTHLNKAQIPPLNIEITPIDDRLIIPRINQNLPIVNVSSKALVNRDWDALEAEIQKSLHDGVVHYPGTGMSGDGGNTVITGHSSYFPWDPGRFKDVFALLHEVVTGDKIIVYHQQKKYVYRVTEIKVVLPKDIDVLKPTTGEQLTLITCTPVGTNLKRLVVIAEPVDEKTDQKISRF